MSGPCPLQVRLRISVPTHPDLALATDIDLQAMHTDNEGKLIAYFEYLPQFPSWSRHGRFRIDRINRVVWDNGSWEGDNDEEPSEANVSGVLESLDRAWMERSRTVVYVTAVLKEGGPFVSKVPLKGKVPNEKDADKGMGEGALGKKDDGEEAVPWNRRLS